MKEYIEDFKKWCEDNTATFDCVDGESDNVSYSQLTFYTELVDKVKELLTKATNNK